MQQYSIFARLLYFTLTSDATNHGFFFLWVFYSKGHPSWNAWQPWWNSVVDRGLTKQYVATSPEYDMKLLSMTTSSNTLVWPDITITYDLLSEMDLSTKGGLFTMCRNVDIEHLQRIWHADRGRSLVLTLILSHIRFEIVLVLKPELVIFLNFGFRMSLGTLFYILPCCPIPPSPSRDCPLRLSALLFLVSCPCLIKNENNGSSYWKRRIKKMSNAHARFFFYLRKISLLYFCHRSPRRHMRKASISS